MNELLPNAKLTPHQWFDLNRHKLLSEMGIKIDEVVAVTPDTIRAELSKVGQIVRERYGEQQFQNELGQQIRKDLMNASNGGALTIIDKGLVVVVSGFKGNLMVQVGFSGGPMKVCAVEGNTRFLTSLGLNLLPGES